MIRKKLDWHFCLFYKVTLKVIKDIYIYIYIYIYNIMEHMHVKVQISASSQPTPIFLPGESQGQRSLVGCRLWGCTESDTTDAT